MSGQDRGQDGGVGGGGVEGRVGVGELVVEQAVDEGEQEAQGGAGVLGAEGGQQWGGPGGEVLLALGDLVLQGGLVGGFGEDGESGEGEGAAGGGEVVYECAEGGAEGVWVDVVEVGGELVPAGGFGVEDAGEDAGEEGFAGAVAVGGGAGSGRGAVGLPGQSGAPVRCAYGAAGFAVAGGSAG